MSIVIEWGLFNLFFIFSIFFADFFLTDSRYWISCLFIWLFLALQRAQREVTWDAGAQILHLYRFTSARKRKSPRSLRACLQRLYSRPEGAPALCDDPSELCQPPGIHLKPLQWVISPGTPGPIIEVIFIEASLWAKIRFLFQKPMWNSQHIWHLIAGNLLYIYGSLFYTFREIKIN